MRYMAPEVALETRTGKARYSNKADVYSYGKLKDTLTRLYQFCFIHCFLDEFINCKTPEALFRQ